MDLLDYTKEFLKNPFPTWKNELTSKLVNNKWDLLKNDGLTMPQDYSTKRCLTNNYSFSLPSKLPISAIEGGNITYLESPSFDQLQDFYNEHGLYPCSQEELQSNGAQFKLKMAFNLLSSIKSVHSDVICLVRSIQVLKQEDDDIDVSYSHPNIPFSIFVSVCRQSSIISDLRVAEGILHEAMHLKLTLIEGVTPLIASNSIDTFYSPWRDEERPLRGVLHGMFVFKAISDFYSELKPHINSPRELDFLEWRVKQIKGETSQLADFPFCPGLTKDGAILSVNLLPLS